MPRAAAQHFVSADTVVWAESQPRGEVRLRFPSAHVQSHFTYQRLCNHHVDAVDACQIHSCDAVQFAAEMELGSILVFLFGRLFLRFSCFHLWCNRIRKTGQVFLQLLVALDHTSLVGIVHLDFLFQHKEQLLAPVAFQAFRNLLLAGLNSWITEFRQLPWIARSGHDGTHDLLSGDSTEIADYVRQLQVHLRHRLLHPQNARPDSTRMFCPLPPIGTQYPNLRSRLE